MSKCHCIIKCAETLEERAQAAEAMRSGVTSQYGLAAYSLQGPCAIEAQMARMTTRLPAVGPFTTRSATRPD